MTQALQKKTKAARGPKIVAKSTYNGVALPTDMAERRRLRNKLSAKVHREKKKESLEGAKQEVFVCDKELTQLESELTEIKRRATTLQAIFDSIEVKFGAETVRDIFEKFGDLDVPTILVDTCPRAVSSDSDDTFTSDDDSFDYSRKESIVEMKEI